MNEGPAKDEKSWLLGYWCVAFVDLLGQRDAFKKTDFLPLNVTPEQKEAFYDAVRGSVGAIRGMRDIHAKIRGGLDLASTDMSLFNGLPADKLEVARSFQVTKVRWYRMSDGMILACPLTVEKGNVPLRGVYEIVLTCAALMTAQLARGRPIRGGIDVGTGVEIDAELFGAALVKAYEIESKCAQYPRIVAGIDFTNMLHGAYRQASRDLRSEFERSLAEDILSTFKFDSDMMTMLDFAGPLVRKMQTGDDPELKESTRSMVAAARTFAIAELAKYRAAADERGRKLAPRYERLVEYLDGCPD